MAFADDLRKQTVTEEEIREQRKAKWNKERLSTLEELRVSCEAAAKRGEQYATIYITDLDEDEREYLLLHLEEDLCASEYGFYSVDFKKYYSADNGYCLMIAVAWTRDGKKKYDASHNPGKGCVIGCLSFVIFLGLILLAISG